MPEGGCHRATLGVGVTYDTASPMTPPAEIPNPAGMLRAVVAQPSSVAAAEVARAAMDKVAWDRGIRSRAAEVAASSRWTGALANAAFEGAVLPTAVSVDMAAGVVPADPMGRVVLAAADLAGQAPRLADLLRTTPLQCLAEAATVVGRGFVPQEQLGRPRLGGCDDPLHLPDLPDAADVPPALAALAVLVARADAPAVLVAAVVHAQLALLRPFPWGSGLVARASIRWVLAGRSVDPDMLCVPEAGLLTLGRPSYVKALAGYRSGAARGAGQWVSAFCSALEAGARAADPVDETDPRSVF